MRDVMKDLRYGLRLLAKNPGFTTVAVLSLALGIGANTAIFTLINAVMLRMLPVKNPQELVSLRIVDPTARGGPASGTGRGLSKWVDGNSETAFPYPTLLQMRERSQVLSDLIGFKVLGRLNTQVNGEAEIARGQMVTPNYFSALGVHLILGRDFARDDDRPEAQPAVVLSHGYWQRRFGGERGVIGRDMVINN